MVHLKNLTKGHTVILGRVTYESMVGYYSRSGRPMPGKTYIVVSRNTAYKPEGNNTLVAHSIEDALAKARHLGDDSIFAIGGFGIFKDILPLADRIYLTQVKTEVQGDAYFPELNAAEWREVSRESHQKDEKNEYDFDMVVLERL